jgi:hypothetical protein
MVRGLPLLRGRRWLLVLCVLTGAGCAAVPRSRVDECQRVAQTLRSENARLKDQVLAAHSQNRDSADRAVDDARRLALQDEALARLEHSVQAYQEERDRLEAAFKQLTSNLANLDFHGEPAAVQANRRSGAQPGAADAGTAARPKDSAGADDAEGKR